ncbi:HNH endonuclease signature motif containing protein [Jiangella muralis]|uniref:HNH endonuclease signature motif containing protein n=1 Tax=Jiangella muralis TaxID=702383 RepID=UPI0012F950FC|nr:HNH endonuclease signature motif containing protein [Jiangella muralis]
MFEEALSSAPPPGIDPVVAPDAVAWPPELDGWEPFDPVAEIDPALLRELRTQQPAPSMSEASQGPALAELLAVFDPSEADTYDLVEAAAGWARLTAWAAAGEAAALAELASRPELRPGASGHSSLNPVTNTAVELAGRCQLTTRQAENQVGHSLQLVQDFSDTHAALSAGLIDLRRARVITDELGGQDHEVRARVETAVLPEAPTLNAVALRKLVKRLLHQLAPVETAERHRLARDGRYVAVTPASDGMAFLEALLPAEDAVALNTTLNAAATDAKRADAAAGAPVRTQDQRRADALTELAWAALATCSGTVPEASGHATERATCPVTRPATRPVTRPATRHPDSAPGRARRRRPVAVQVTIPFTTLIGLDDQPGDLDGYGPIPAATARELAAAGVWTWLSTEPGTGQLLEHGRTRSRPTVPLADLIVARARTCRAPGCHQPAHTGDLDHVVPFAQGGTTSPGNLHALCTTHHLLKHHGGWSVTRHRDGTTRWRSPTAHEYTRAPERVGSAAGSASPPR